jgi:hypothetical protein
VRISRERGQPDRGHADTGIAATWTPGSAACGHSDRRRADTEIADADSEIGGEDRQCSDHGCDRDVRRRSDTPSGRRRDGATADVQSTTSEEPNILHGGNNNDILTAVMRLSGDSLSYTATAMRLAASRWTLTG